MTSKTTTRLRHILRVCSSVAAITRYRTTRATSRDSEVADVRGSCSPRPGTMTSFGTRSIAPERDSRSSGAFHAVAYLYDFTRAPPASPDCMTELLRRHSER